LTSLGTVLGTIEYMSPEQIAGKEADARSDIFALGAVLYEAATGRRAFGGKTQISVASAILEKEPEPISAVKPLTPLLLEQVVKGCLAKSPDDRFQTAHDVKLQLKWMGENANQMAAAAAPRGRARRDWLLWSALAALLLLLFAAGAMGWWRTRSPQAAVASHVVAPQRHAIRAAQSQRTSGVFSRRKTPRVRRQPRRQDIVVGAFSRQNRCRRTAWHQRSLFPFLVTGLELHRVLCQRKALKNGCQWRAADPDL
jgi:Protein kinase domain